MTKRLQRALEEQKQSTSQVNLRFSGVLGIPLSGSRIVEVPNRKGYVYVRLRDNLSEVIQAFNNQVSPSYNLPVIVERVGNKYIVSGVDTERYENNWNSHSPYLPRHGNAHSFDIESGGGGDIVWVYPRQFMPLLVFPSGSLGAPSVIVAPYTLRKDGGSWQYVGNTGTRSFAPYRPTSSTGAVMGLVYLDTNDGNPYLLINSGTVFSNSITGSSQIVPYIPQLPSPSSQIPLAAIRLITGTNQISWDNIYDVRQFLHNTPTGTGGGSASINTGTLNSLYLRLDASNDPVTGPLAVISNNAANASVNDALLGVLNRDANSSRSAFYAASVSGGYGGTLSAKNSNVLIVDQVFDGGYETLDDDNVGIYGSRFQSDSFPRSVSKSPFLIVADFDGDMDYYGGTLLHTDPYGSKILHLNPQATGSAIPYTFNTQYHKPTGTIHTQWLASGTQVAHLDVSGTFHSNGSPLVKEAPVDGISYVRRNAGWEQSSGGSIDTGTLDGRYLKLDTSNDPLTGGLEILPLDVSQIGLYITARGGAIAHELDHIVTGSVFVANPTWFLYRSPHGLSKPNFTAPFVQLQQDRVSGTISGELLKFISDNNERVVLNPSAQGTGTLAYLDSDFVLSPDGKLLELANNGASRFYVDASGTAKSNNQPLIKEAPTDGLSYVRKNAGWEAGAGGSVETNANDIYAVSSPGGVSAFVGTIATLPGGATLTYNVTSGIEGAMVPVSTSQLAKMRLYNTTRGTHALISNCNAGTNTLTLTANVPAGWTVGDVITIASQTVSGGSVNWVDLEITSGPTGRNALFINMVINSGTVGDAMRTHPFETPFSTSKYIPLFELAANQATVSNAALLKVVNNVFCLSWTGTPTVIQIREAGYLA